MAGLDERTRLSLWLHHGTAGSARRFREALLRLGAPEEAFRAAQRGARGALAPLPEPVAARLAEAARPGFLDRYEAWLSEHGVGVCLLGDEDYPALLSEISDAPPLLFYRGRMQADMRLPVAIVGARRCTPYGRDVARHFARELTMAGCTVVSGMADGIDGCAAEGALSCEEAPYPTVAVLGSGIDVVYPASHRALYEQIAARGAVVTEFPPGTRPLRENFPVRNRIISGMSRGVLVVEAGERSGTSITAGHALDQGREVFAVPGRITDLQSVGPNRMIQRGEARPVFCAADILAEFALLEEHDSFAHGPKRVPRASLAPGERAVCAALETGEQSFDELAEALALPLDELNSLLTGLEFSGIIKPLPGRLYALDTLNVALTDD